MPNPKGKPENLQPIKSHRETPLPEKLSFRVTKEMKEEVQQKENPPEFCREAIQEKLDRDRKNSQD